MHKGFRLLHLLTDPPRRTIAQLAQILEISKRAAYKYVDTLRDLGYEIQSDHQNRYYLIDYQKYTSLDLPSPSEILLVQQARKVQQLLSAIEEQRQLELCPYQSASEQTIKNRLIEPYALSDDQHYVLAYEPERGEPRPYKLSRIGQIKELHTPFSQEPLPYGIDLFGFSGQCGHAEWVELQLSPLAYRLLIEEYPAAREYISGANPAYHFKAPIYHYTGISRFIMGLPGEIEVLETEGLRRYLAEKLSILGLDNSFMTN